MNLHGRILQQIGAARGEKLFQAGLVAGLFIGAVLVEILDEPFIGGRPVRLLLHERRNELVIGLGLGAQAFPCQPVRGEIVEVELERENGRWEYEVELLTASGTVIDLTYDAATARLLETEGAGVESARKRP